MGGWKEGKVEEKRKIDITAVLYHDPAMIGSNHRQVVIQTGGDGRRVLRQPAVIDYYRWFGLNRR